MPVAIRIAVTLVLLNAIIILSVTPGDAEFDDGTFVWIVVMTPTLLQKSLHVLAYAALAAAFFWTFERVSPTALRTAAALLPAVAIGALLEWCQTFVPGRYGSLRDLLLNAFGAALGLIVVALCRRRAALRATPLAGDGGS